MDQLLRDIHQKFNTSGYVTARGTITFVYGSIRASIENRETVLLRVRKYGPATLCEANRILSWLRTGVRVAQGPPPTISCQMISSHGAMVEYQVVSTLEEMGRLAIWTDLDRGKERRDAILYGVDVDYGEKEAPQPFDIYSEFFTMIRNIYKTPIHSWGVIDDETPARGLWSRVFEIKIATIHQLLDELLKRTVFPFSDPHLIARMDMRTPTRFHLRESVDVLLLPENREKIQKAAERAWGVPPSRRLPFPLIPSMSIGPAWREKKLASYLAGMASISPETAVMLAVRDWIWKVYYISCEKNFAPQIKEKFAENFAKLFGVQFRVLLA